jgi:hypothetical protein
MRSAKLRTRCHDRSTPLATTKDCGAERMLMHDFIMAELVNERQEPSRARVRARERPFMTEPPLPGGKQWTFGLAGKAPAGLRQSHPARWSWAGLLPVPDAVGASAKAAVSARVAAPTIARRCCLPILCRLSLSDASFAPGWR